MTGKTHLLYVFTSRLCLQSCQFCLIISLIMGGVFVIHCPQGAAPADEFFSSDLSCSRPPRPPLRRVGKCWSSVHFPTHRYERSDSLYVTSSCQIFDCLVGACKKLIHEWVSRRMIFDVIHHLGFGRNGRMAGQWLICHYPNFGGFSRRKPPGRNGRMAGQNWRLTSQHSPDQLTREMM